MNLVLRADGVDVLFVSTTFSLRGPALPSTLSFSPLLPSLPCPFFRFFRPVPPFSFSAINAASSSSCFIASRRAGTVSQRVSYPRLILALLFCSDWMWFAFFCEGDRRGCFCVGVIRGVSEEVGEVDDDVRLRLEDDACLEVDCEDEDDGVDEEESGEGCTA
jgi:hypothetical protein